METMTFYFLNNTICFVCCQPEIKIASIDHFWSCYMFESVPLPLLPGWSYSNVEPVNALELSSGIT